MLCPPPPLGRLHTGDVPVIVREFGILCKQRDAGTGDDGGSGYGAGGAEDSACTGLTTPGPDAYASDSASAMLCRAEGLVPGTLSASGGGGVVVFGDAYANNVSATLVRRMAKCRVPLTGLVTHHVQDYIAAHALYLE
jgi:hypothetical protein